jgi:hypothetical protein
MWGLAYIVTAFIAPNVSPDTPALFYGIFGGLILFCLLLQRLGNDKVGDAITRCLWCALGAIEVFSGVASWTGYGLWNVPFPNKELFQVSMAFADLISAVFMFVLATESNLSKQ